MDDSMEVKLDKKIERRVDNSFAAKRRRMTAAEADAIWERTRGEEPLELEKNDLRAIILASLAVFVPFVLAFSGLLFFVWVFIIFIWGG